jgi:hypothetical protein
MEYLSLYDYLGKAAGNDLGKEVAAAAYKAGVKMQEREISNTKFTGKVLLYPKDFLDFILENQNQFIMEDLPGTLNRVIDEDDLPF